jgi:hypothetical protein
MNNTKGEMNNIKRIADYINYNKDSGGVSDEDG